MLWAQNAALTLRHLGSQGQSTHTHTQSKYKEWYFAVPVDAAACQGFFSSLFCLQVDFSFTPVCTCWRDAVTMPPRGFNTNCAPPPTPHITHAQKEKRLKRYIDAFFLINPSNQRVGTHLTRHMQLCINRNGILKVVACRLYHPTQFPLLCSVHVYQPL